MHSVDENEDVLVTVVNGIGRITLNRPKAINSLTHPMVTEIAQALKTWENDDAITRRRRRPARVTAGSAPAATSSRSITTRRPAAPRAASSGTTNTC